jgi:hypothetical protein
MTLRPLILSASVAIVVVVSGLGAESAAAGPTGVSEVDDIFWCIDQLTTLVFTALGLYALKCQVMNTIRQQPVQGQFMSCSVAMTSCAAMNTNWYSTQPCAQSGSYWHCTWKASVSNRANSVFNVPGIMQPRGTAFCNEDWQYDGCHSASVSGAPGDCTWLPTSSCSNGGTYTFSVDVDPGKCARVTGLWGVYASQSALLGSGLGFEQVQALVAMGYEYIACYGQQGGLTQVYRYA